MGNNACAAGGNNTALRTLERDKAAGLSTAPAEALLFDAGPFAFADDPKEGKAPVKMRARSGEPLNHWYWGRAAHDMAGFTPAADTIPIDYCHYPEEVLGFLNSFTPSNQGLDVAGELVSFQPSDRSAEVTHKARAGVPYQASIYFDPKVLEDVLPGAETEVNGYKLAGPALVFRKWSLRGVAVCPYGYDPKTSTKLSAHQAGEIPIQFVPLTQDPAPMSATPAPETKPAEKPATELAETKPVAAETKIDPRAEFKAILAKFTASFGAANGAAWAAEGLSYEAALEKHAAELAASNKKLGEEKTALEGKLAAIPRGEKDPVSFTDADPKGAESKDLSHLKNHLGDNLARFAAGVKLPGKK